MPDDSHCTVYLDISASLEQVVEEVRAQVGGVAQRAPIDSAVLDIYGDENDEHDAVRADDPVEYPYLVDVEARPGVSADAWRTALNTLLQALARPGVRFVTAAQDEDALWHGGRWDGSGSSGAGEGRRDRP